MALIANHVDRLNHLVGDLSPPWRAGERK